MVHEKKAKIESLDLKNLLFGGIFLSRIVGYPTPLNGQSLCSKKLSGKGGYPPLNGKNPLSVFEGFPTGSCSSQRECPQPLIALSATKHKYMYCTMYIHVVLYNTSIYVE